MVKEGRKYVYFYNQKVKKWFKAKRLRSGKLKIVGTVSESEVKGVQKARKSKNRNIYLGKKVKDVGRKGLDTLKEVEDICKAILDDYKKKRISYAKAVKRLVFLKTTVIKRNKKLEGKKKKAYAIVDKYLKKVRK